MASNFSAEQFEDRFKSTRLCNWELPKPPGGRPRAHKNTTKILCDNSGRFLKDSYKDPESTPWSNFRSTWELPDRLTRNFASEYNDCLEQRCRTKTPKNCKNLPDLLHHSPNCPDKCETLKPYLGTVDKQFNIGHKVEKKNKCNCTVKNQCTKKCVR